MHRRYLRASTVGPSSNISDVAYYGVMPFSRQLRDIESSIRERRAATALPPPVSTYWRAFASPYGRDSKVSRHTTRTFKSFNPRLFRVTIYVKSEKQKRKGGTYPYFR